MRKMEGTVIAGKLLRLAMTLGLAALLGFSAAVSAAPFDQQTMGVSMVDNRFDPSNLTIPVGSTVVWTNNGAVPHTTTSDSGIWDSGSMSPGQTFSHNFSTAGSFPYHCTFHVALGMVGTITVQAAATATTSPPTATATAAAAATATAPATPTIAAAVSPSAATPTPPLAAATPAGTSVPSPGPTVAVGAATPSVVPTTAATALPRTGDGPHPWLLAVPLGVLAAALILRRAAA